MTPEDLAQITAVIAASEQRTNAATAAAIAASEQRTTAAIAAAIAASEQRTTAAIAAAEERSVARQDHLLESVAAEFSSVRGDIKTRFLGIELRLERIENFSYSINLQTAGMNKAIVDGERLMSEFTATQMGRSQAFSDLQARVAKIERELHPERH